MAWAVALLSAIVAVGAVLVVLQLVRTRRYDNRFRCKIRVAGGWLPGYTSEWSKRTMRAGWARDVLIVFRGRVFVRAEGLPVARAEGRVRNAPRREVSRLGRNPILIDLILDGGVRLQVAAPASAQDLLCGPYLVAEVQASRRS
jgi:hypothetical protein